VKAINMRINYFIWLILVLIASPTWMAYGQTTVAPTPDQLAQIIRSQPVVDVSAPVTATASFDPPLVRPGEKSIYRVTFDATEISVQLPAAIPATPTLELRRTVSGQNMLTVGGTMRMASAFNYDARPAKPGVFTVPEFTAMVYGLPVVVPAAQLEVKIELPEPHQPVRQLTLATSATNVFVGEPFDISVRLPATPAHPAEGIWDLQLNGEGFMEDKSTVRQSIRAIEQNGQKVPAFIYEASIIPISAGPIVLSAQGFTSGMQFSGAVVISGQVSFGGGPPKPVLLESEPTTINVRPLPVGDELPGFTGAVGSYTCDPPNLATNVLKTGEPVELTVIVRSSQNLNRLNPPLAPTSPGWQIFPAERGGIIAGTGSHHPGVIFKYTFIPLSTQVHATPAIPFSSFDPSLGRYVNLTVPPLPVTVMAGQTQTDADSALVLASNSTEPEKKSGLSGLARRPGHTAGSLVPMQLHTWFPLVAALPALGFCVLWLWDRRRRYLEQHPEIIRRRQARRALRRELRLLEQAADAGDSTGFIQRAVNCLQIASAPYYPATPRALVCGDVLQILTPPEREGKPGETVRRFFAAANAAAFANRAGSHSEFFAEKFALKEILWQLEARL
jgi:hypothetical protein